MLGSFVIYSIVFNPIRTLLSWHLRESRGSLRPLPNFVPCYKFWRILCILNWLESSLLHIVTFYLFSVQAEVVQLYHSNVSQDITWPYLWLSYSKVSKMCILFCSLILFQHATFGLKSVCFVAAFSFNPIWYTLYSAAGKTDKTHDESRNQSKTFHAYEQQVRVK